MDQQLVRELALVPGDFIDGVDLLRAIDARLGDVAVFHRRFLRSAGGHWLELAPPAGPTFREWDCGNGITARSSREPLARASAGVAAALDALVQIVSRIVQSGEQLRPHMLQTGHCVPVPREQWPFVNPLDESTRYPRANAEAFVRSTPELERGETSAPAVATARKRSPRPTRNVRETVIETVIGEVLEGRLGADDESKVADRIAELSAEQGHVTDPRNARKAHLAWAREALVCTNMIETGIKKANAAVRNGRALSLPQLTAHLAGYEPAFSRHAGVCAERALAVAKPR